MAYLCRKISSAKWEKKDYLAESEISADAITVDMRTSESRLSFWICNRDNSDWKEAALALAANMEKLETFHLLLLEQSDLDEGKFPVVKTDGNTRVRDLVQRHRDMERLDTVRLCELAMKIVRRVRETPINNIETVTKAEMRKILKNAVELGRVKLEDFDEKRQRKLLEALRK